MREIVLLRFKEHPGHFLMQTSVSKSNGKDMSDCFINTNWWSGYIA